MKYLLCFLAGAAMGIAAMLGLGLGPGGLPADDSAATAAELSDLRLTVERQKLELARQRDELAARRDALAQLEAQLAVIGRAGPPPGATAAEADPAAPARPKSPMAQVAAMMENPAMRDMIATQQQQAMEMAYADLIKRLDLTPEERTHFLKLLTDRQMAQMDVGLKALDAKLTPDDRAALAQQVKDSLAAADAKIQEFMNDEADFAAYKTFTEQQPERQQLTMLSPALARINQPLTPAQSDALAGLMYAERKDFKFSVDLNDPGQAAANGPVLDEAAGARVLEEQGQLQNRIAEKAAEILNPAQLEAFRQAQANQLQIMKMGLEMARSMSAEQN